MADDKVHHPGSLAELRALFSSTTYVVVDFTASWCGPCQHIAPIFAKLAADKSVPGHLAFAKVDVDAARDAAQEYTVTAMPTFMFFKEGKQVAVHGQAVLRGADPRALGAAADKLGGLALKRAAEAGNA
jgi:thioredoxin 1